MSVLPVLAYPADLSLPGEAERLYGRIKADGHTVSVLVNNAGVGLIGPAEAHDPAAEDAMLRLNTEAPVALCRLFLRDRYAAGSGKLLNVCSTGAFQPGPYTASYYATKSFLYSYTRALRREAAGKGVQVCALCPGGTDTAFFARAGGRKPPFAMTPEAVAEAAFRGLRHNRAVIVPGVLNRLLRLLPSSVKSAAVARMKQNTAAVPEKSGRRKK